MLGNCGAVESIRIAVCYDCHFLYGRSSCSRWRLWRLWWLWRQSGRWGRCWEWELRMLLVLSCTLLMILVVLLLVLRLLVLFAMLTAPTIPGHNVPKAVHKIRHTFTDWCQAIFTWLLLLFWYGRYRRRWFCRSCRWCQCRRHRCLRHFNRWSIFVPFA